MESSCSCTALLCLTVLSDNRCGQYHIVYGQSISSGQFLCYFTSCKPCASLASHCRGPEQIVRGDQGGKQSRPMSDGATDRGRKVLAGLMAEGLGDQVLLLRIYQVGLYGAHMRCCLTQAISRPVGPHTTSADEPLTVFGAWQDIAGTAGVITAETCTWVHTHAYSRC